MTITAQKDTATLDLTTGNTLTQAAPGVLGNDSDSDGDSLTVTLFAALGQTPAVAAGTADPGLFGSLTLNSDGSYTYTANNSLKPVAVDDNNIAKIGHSVSGDVLTNDSNHLADNFTYTANDGNGETASANLDITLNLGTLSVTPETVTGTYGTLHLNADGTYTHTPPIDTLTFLRMR
jgi:VCBS repeat-containing protein